MDLLSLRNLIVIAVAYFAARQKLLGTALSKPSLLPSPLSISDHGSCPLRLVRSDDGPPVEQWLDDCLSEKNVHTTSQLPSPLELSLESMSKSKLIALRQKIVRFAFDRQSHIIRHGLAAKCRPKIVAYICKKGMTCGGLGDRIRGIITGFYQALLTDSVFVTELTSPLPHTMFFENAVLSPPFQEAWLRCRSEGHVASWNAMDSNHMQMFDYRAGWQNATFIEVAANAPPYLMIWGNPNLAAPLHRIGLEDMSYSLAASVAISLYHGQPTPLLQGICMPLIAALRPGSAGDFHVGLQIRTGGDGSFPDPPRHAVSVTAQFVQKALDVCAGRATVRCTLFLTSDHPQSLDIAEQYLLQLGKRVKLASQHVMDFALPALEVRLVYFNERIMHLDRRTSEVPVDVVSKPYADWYLLAFHMDFLLISSSGFGVSAALANFSEHLMYVSNTGFVDTNNCSEHHCQQMRGAWQY